MPHDRWPVRESGLSCDDRLRVCKPEFRLTCSVGRHLPCCGEMLDQQSDSCFVAFSYLCEKFLGLRAKVLEIGPSRESLCHASSMRFSLGSANRRARRSCG